jgi:hypothetical protein
MKPKKAALKIRVMPEYGSSGIWGFSDAPSRAFRHGMLEHRKLKLPRELSDRLDRWIVFYEDQSLLPQTDVATLNAEGLQLAQRVQQHLGPARHVEYQGEDERGELLPPVVMVFEPGHPL